MEKKLYVYMMRSRNKDNKDIIDFKERSKNILVYAGDELFVEDLYKRFVAEGKPNEKARLYRSVNARDEDKIRDNLIARLAVEHYPVSKINNLVNSVSQDKSVAIERAWLFDFDCNDYGVLKDFINDIIAYSDADNIKTVKKTPNGYAVVCYHGFEHANDLIQGYAYQNIDITLMRDDMLFMDIRTTEEPTKSFDTYVDKEAIINERTPDIDTDYYRD